MQGVRVLVSRVPDRKHDWSQRHEFNEVCADEFIVEKNGMFLAMFSPGKILRPVGKETSFQVALALAEKNGEKITWKNTFSVLPQSVTMLTIPGPPPISETMRIINGAPSYSQSHFNPAKLVRAVNHLRPMGKEKALSELRAFLKVACNTFWDVTQRLDDDIDTSDHTSVFLIVRLLFEPDDPNGKLPPIMTLPFTPTFERHIEDKPLWPLLPLHLQDDVPFLLVLAGGGMSGSPEHPESHVNWAERHGRIRSRVLRPVGSPLAAAERLAALPQTTRLFASEFSAFDFFFDFRNRLRIYDQAWNAIIDADPEAPKPTPTPPINTWEAVDWNARREAAAKLDVQWDEAEQRYVVKRR